MEPSAALTLAAIEATKQAKQLAISSLGKFIKEKVVDEFRSRRELAFFSELTDQIVRESISGIETAALDKVLSNYLNDPGKAELLFESYRRVWMSASNDLGPRIIAILTCRLLGKRSGTEYEERMFLASERLGDRDLREFANAVREGTIRNEDPNTLFPMAAAKEVVDVIKNRDELLIYSGGEFDLPPAMRRLEYYQIVNLYPSTGWGGATNLTATVPRGLIEFAELIDRATGPS
ncbi:MAG: hypothetical protein EOP09_00235 [Proteobacteria bacterium]|nr:MAG: hypothetical protein EOP09_00235 [Pseudomonadota bacterium]